jgi:hypothetical protein
MSINRVVSLAAAFMLTGTQWTALSCPLTHTQSVRAVVAGAPVADDVSDSSLPVILITAHRGIPAGDGQGH